MAIRQVYVPKETAPYYIGVDMDFEWNGGFAASQKQKNIKNLHDAFRRRFHGKEALEISSKSSQDGGVALSAFNLKKFVPSKNDKYTVECVFQSGKVFEQGGPYTDLLDKTSKEAKRDERLQNSGNLVKFVFEDKEFPLRPETLFYDFIYINALIENPELASKLDGYDGFTDIEFNPNRSRNCQAKACAAYVSLKNQGLLDKVTDYESFKELYAPKVIRPKVETVTKPTVTFKAGNKVKHPVYGESEVVSVDENHVILNTSDGDKRIGLDWAKEKLVKM